LQIITIERDVQRSARDGDLFLRFDDPADAFGELNAATLDSDEDQAFVPALSSMT
jgi:hypothetical protein